MVPPGPPAPFEGSQAVPSQTFMWSNSGLLGSSGSGMPSQGAFPSMVSPRNQLGNMNMLGNMPNVSSLLQQSLANNAGPSPGISGPGSGQQRALMDNGAESDPLGNGMGCNVPSGSFVSSSQNAKANATVTFQGGQQFSSPNMNQMLADMQSNTQMDPNYFQHCQQSMNRFNATSNPQNQLQQQQGQSIRAGLGAVGMVKPEPQTANDQTPQQLQATIQSSPGAVKLEPQQLQSMRSLPPVKMEPQSSDSPLFSPHQQQQQLQQQQQQYLNASRQSPHAAAAAQILHQQRLTQLQQQQLAKGIPQQRVPVQQQFQAQNLPTRSPVKPIYEPGMCARRLTHYMYQQQHRPEDNNIEYWKKFVAEYFAPNAKKKWCVSMYGSGRQITGVFPQDIWHCEICNRKPGRGFEATVEVLPRLFKLKYESGTLDELLYVDMPREYQNSSGQIVLDYAKAIQESVFEQLRVVRDGQLRIVFSQDLKICSWEFCARRHEELIPKRLLIPQVQQLGAAAQKYQAATQSAPANISVTDLQNNCNMFIASARQLAKTLEVPLVNDLGYSKRYIRCLQISEVVNSMKDLIDFSRESGVGPMESLAKFPRRTGSFSGINNGQPQQSEDQQQQNTPGLSSNGDDCIPGAASMQVSCSNGMLNVNNPGTSSGNRLLHQNSMNSRQQNQMNSGGGMSPYMGGTNSQLPSPSSSSTTLPQTQTIPSPIQPPMPSSSNNPQQQQLAVPSSSDAAANESQSSVQKIIQDMMMTSQLGGGGGMMGMNNMGNDLKNANGLLPPTNNSNGLVGNGFGGGSGFGNGRGGGQDAAMVNGIRAALRNNSSMTAATTTNGRIGMTFPREQSLNQQHDMGNNQPINGLGSVNGFNNLQFDWKPSP